MAPAVVAERLMRTVACIFRVFGSLIPCRFVETGHSIFVSSKLIQRLVVALWVNVAHESESWSAITHLDWAWHLKWGLGDNECHGMPYHNCKTRSIYDDRVSWLSFTHDFRTLSPSPSPWPFHRSWPWYSLVNSTADTSLIPSNHPHPRRSCHFWFYSPLQLTILCK